MNEDPAAGLYYVRTRGKSPGLVLTPYIDENDCYVVGRHNREWVRVPRRQMPDLRAFLAETGYRLRMGAPGHHEPPSLIALQSIQGTE